jgi:hypothetical protein
MIKGNDPLEPEINGFRPKGIDFTGAIEITGQLHCQKDDLSKSQEYCRTNNITVPLQFPDVFSYKYKFNYNLHKYVDIARQCQFAIQETASGQQLHAIDKASWDSLVAFVKQNLVPEILFYTNFYFRHIKKRFPGGHGFYEK